MLDRPIPRGTEEVRRFGRPYPSEQLDRAVCTRGGAIMEGAVPQALWEQARAGIDEWLDRHFGAAGGPSRSGRDLRVTALADKVPGVAEVTGHPDIAGWARRMLSPVCGRIRIGEAEYLERAPGEKPHWPPRGLHRGTDAWRNAPIGMSPAAVHAIVPLTPFTAENGGMWLALGSHWLPGGAGPDPRTLVQATTGPGDAIVFRSDLIHCAGGNTSPNQPRRTLSIGYQADWLEPVVPPSSGGARWTQ